MSLNREIKSKHNVTPGIQLCLVCSHVADFWINGSYQAPLHSSENVKQTFATLGVPDLFFCRVSFPQQTPKALLAPSLLLSLHTLFCVNLICELLFTVQNGHLWIKGQSVHHYALWEAVVFFRWNFDRACWVSRWYLYMILSIFYSYFHFSTVSVSSCQAEKSVTDEMRPFVKD